MRDGPRRGRTTDLAANALREAILDGAVAPSTWLREAELATVLDVSRTPVREALRLLADEGLVVKTPNQGTMVAPVSLEDVLALYLVREHLEGLAARLAAGLAAGRGTGVARRLNALNDELAEAANGSDLPAMVRLNLDFHREIRLAVGNVYLDRFLGQVEHAVRRLPASTFARPDRRSAALEEHRAIARAIAAGDRDAAQEVAQHHMRQARAARIGELAGD
ncbi:GntR family transcriptional regulator [Actinomadura sp. KC06]|uniref:GntR family transcriptional regulator n=1 Tax=Actinomadura sp. KC06 TaxID=2530369 RepID=UPI001A9CE7EA|nr:GntR family transcriptional regulator [Actinomadura sp. KC06]